MRALGLALVSLFSLAACADDNAASDPATAQKKLAAKNSMQSAVGNAEGSAVTTQGVAVGSTPPSAPTAPADKCTEQRWYGDGECDAWCPKGDPADCNSAGMGVVCAAFFSEADGYCDVSDPCGPVQDADCQNTGSGGGGDCGGGGSSGSGGSSTPPSPGMGDGTCAPKSYSELVADPDCANLICPAIYSPADGKCDAKVPCDFVIDADCAGVKEPVACIEIAYPKDGKCEAAAGCEANDPDC